MTPNVVAIATRGLLANDSGLMACSYRRRNSQASLPRCNRHDVDTGRGASETFYEDGKMWTA